MGSLLQESGSFVWIGCSCGLGVRVGCLLQESGFVRIGCSCGIFTTGIGFVCVDWLFVRIGCSCGMSTTGIGVRADWVFVWDVYYRNRGSCGLIVRVGSLLRDRGSFVWIGCSCGSVFVWDLYYRNQGSFVRDLYYRELDVRIGSSHGTSITGVGVRIGRLLRQVPKDRNLGFSTIIRRQLCGGDTRKRPSAEATRNTHSWIRPNTVSVKAVQCTP
jgi:hypothetical protein